MIYITRPIPQTHKVIPTNININLEKKYLDNDVNRDKSNTYNQDKTTNRGNINLSQLEEAVVDINDFLFRENSRFEFKIHERTNRVMVKLMDNDTNEVIREIPPEKMLDIVGGIWDFVGILVDERG